MFGRFALEGSCTVGALTRIRRLALSMTWLERERGSPVQYRDWHVGVKQARRSLVILLPTRAELGTIILRRNVAPVGSWLMRRFDWTTELRHETGRRDTGETTA